VLGQQSLPDAILGLAVLLASVIIHENAHGVAALALGDDTARNAKRLTLNPIKHLDIVGSIIMPVFLFFAGLPMFGYAKPVPVTPSKLRGTDRTGFALVAAAGPASNVALAFISVVVLKQLGVTFFGGQALAPEGVGLAQKIFFFAFSWNLVLAAFNLLPIPPLDGSRFLRVFLSTKGRHTLDRIEPFGFLILFGLLVYLQEPVFRLVSIIEDGILRLLPL
jgi:Zn-dependent protease